MLRKLLRASAALALLAAACGGTTTAGTGAQPAAAGTCANAKAPHHAYVVVEHLSGVHLQRCVGFDGAQITGEALMKQSSVEYRTQTMSFGKAVCQVDNEPAQFSECLPKGKPYWSLLTSSGGAAWAVAQTGISQLSLKDGDALGWQYREPTGSPSPPPLPKRV